MLNTKLSRVDDCRYTLSHIFLWEITHVVLQFIYKHSVKNIHITHKTIPGCTTIMNPQFENQKNGTNEYNVYATIQ